MLLKVQSACVHGIRAQLIDIEVDWSTAMKHVYHVVGLPDTAIRESTQRVRAAIRNSGFDFPKSGKVTVNLAPADFRKEGSGYDLPIALALLGLTGSIDPNLLGDWVILGELSLDGRVRPVRGALPVALSAERQGIRKLLLPSENSCEAAVVDGVEVYQAISLPQVRRVLAGESNGAGPVRVDAADLMATLPQRLSDMREVKGQQSAKRALEVACAGGHNLLMIGPPGSGKTMLAKRIPSIMPAMTFPEALETTAIHSVAGLLRQGPPFLSRRPFRAPHHTISPAGLAGGSSNPRPGEVSLAHNGLLFLDELPEFQRQVLEVLRQPLEDGEVTISRASRTVTFPARFMLAAAMNPCPCGYRGAESKECTCTDPQVRRYRSKISGPLLDRIDLHIEVAEVRYDDLARAVDGEPSETIAARVRDTRGLQLRRFKGFKMYCNAQMGPRHIAKWCALTDDCRKVLEEAFLKLGFSARGYDRVLKVARTIADMDGSTEIQPQHISEAVQYRSLDRSRFEDVVWNW